MQGSKKVNGDQARFSSEPEILGVDWAAVHSSEYWQPGGIHSRTSHVEEEEGHDCKQRLPEKQNSPS